jgi:hypothetical protein
VGDVIFTTHMCTADQDDIPVPNIPATFFYKFDQMLFYEQFVADDRIPPGTFGCLGGLAVRAFVFMSCIVHMDGHMGEDEFGNGIFDLRLIEDLRYDRV